MKMTKEQFEKAAKELGYTLGRGLTVVRDEEPVLLYHLNREEIAILSDRLDLCEEACRMARAIEKKVAERPPEGWDLDEDSCGTVAILSSPSYMIWLDRKTPAFWDSLIALAKWAKKRGT